MSEATPPFDGLLHLDGWAGRTRTPVRVVGETPKRYRIEMLQSTPMPGRRYLRAGQTTLVPKFAITEAE